MMKKLQLVLVAITLLVSFNVKADEVIKNSDLNLTNPDVRKCLIEASKTDGWRLASVTMNKANKLVLIFDKGDTTRVYTSSTFGTVNYTTGQVVLTSANITSISNVDGATSTIIRVFAIPSSNDIVPVRNQVLQIDTANSTINGEVDAVESGSSQAGTTYTTTSSYSSY